MVKSRSPFEIIKPALMPALAAIVIGYFAIYAVFGQNGFLAYGDYRRQIQVKQAELTTLQAQVSKLEHRVKLLDPRHADPDLIEELIRRETGQVRPDEVIITK